MVKNYCVISQVKTTVIALIFGDNAFLCQLRIRRLFYFDKRFTRHVKDVVRNIVAIASELNGFHKTYSTLRHDFISMLLFA